MKPLPSRRKFLVHYTPTHQFTVSFYSKPHTWIFYLLLRKHGGGTDTENCVCVRACVRACVCACACCVSVCSVRAYVWCVVCVRMCGVVCSVRSCVCGGGVCVGGGGGGEGRGEGWYA